ncbi:MAG: hypothetical protein KGL39_03965 [Patescibacteria group bacterium]|nr:hypothetical protein [Patescibacteria group bacterium]
MTDLERRLRLRLPRCECKSDDKRWEPHDPRCIYRLVLEAADWIAGEEERLTDAEVAWAQTREE